MRKRYRCLSLLLLTCMLVSKLIAFAAVSPLPDYRPIPRDLDAESAFALGKKTSFQSAGIYEFELISGISDLLAQRILQAKPKILQQACDLSPSKQHQALLSIKGIGRIRSKTIAQYFDFSCQGE